MKKIILSSLYFAIALSLNAQNVEVGFKPKNSAVAIDSIRATNLNTNQTVKLTGSETLTLVKTTTGIGSLPINSEKGQVFPNPCDGIAAVCFSTPKSQDVNLKIFNASGQLVSDKQQMLEEGQHRFSLQLPGQGIYYIAVQKGDESLNYKVVSVGKGMQSASISYTGKEQFSSVSNRLNQLKSAVAGKTLSYVDGNNIMYTLYSGKNATVITDKAGTSKTYDVSFNTCADKDGSSYKTVTIGTQTWMAENLAFLPTVCPPTQESNQEVKYYVLNYYGTNITEAKATINYNTFGVLYNWNAAIKACPEGWRLPYGSDWDDLFDFAGGANIANKKLLTIGTKYWGVWNNATDEFGFSALPGGDRRDFSFYDGVGRWWAASYYYDPYDSNKRVNFYLAASGYNPAYIGSSDCKNGLSVRCVRNVDVMDFNYVNFTDIRDGHIYKSIQIGSQIWMAENLAYMPNANLFTTESNIDLYYYVYDYEGTNVDEAKKTDNYNTYGVLYNKSAAMKACPGGWHLPANEEWKILTDYIDNHYGQLREMGSRHWKAPNWEATNTVGFTALPGGCRDFNEYYDKFQRIGIVGYWWSASKDQVSSDNDVIGLDSGEGLISTYNSLSGYSVRCVKD